MQDYLEKPKKKKKKEKHVKNIQIIDDDININDLRTTQESEILVDLLDPEGPSIVYDIPIDNKPKEDSRSKWIKLDFTDHELETQKFDSKNLFKKKDSRDKPKNEDSKKIIDDDDDLDLIPRRSIFDRSTTGRQKSPDSDLDYIPRIKKEKLDIDEEIDENKVRQRKPTKEEEFKKAKESALKAKYSDWKMGLTQKKEKEEKISEFLYESEKPLARYADDKDLDALLKNQEREDDPMLAYLKKNKPEDHKEKKSGETLKPKYRGPPAQPNRYNILPGSKWDGVDRSNGFEKKYFESINARKVFQDEAYKWSTEDM